MAKIVIKDGELSSSAGINIPGSLSVSGNVTIGDVFTDTLTVNANSTFNDDLTVLDTISGSIGRFTVITASFVGPAADLYNLTASGILNFTNDVRNQFSAGTNVTITDGVISSTGGSGSPGGIDATIQFNSGSAFSGSTNLIYNYTTNILSGTTAQFTTVTASRLVVNSNPSGDSVSVPSITFSPDPDTGIYWQSSGQFSFTNNGVRSFAVNSSGLSSNNLGGIFLLSTAGNTAAAPAYSFNSDSDTGMYRPVANNIAFATAGSQRLLITDTNISVSGSLIVTGSTTSNVFQAGTGSATAVSYGFGASGADTGIYRTAINQLGIATNGAEAVRFVNQISGAQIQMSSLGGTAGAPTLTWNADNNTGIFRAAADQIGFSTNAAERMRITNTGIGIGVASPAQTLDISGTLRIGSLVAGTNTAIGRSSDGDITAATSDQRLKKDVTTITGALNSVCQLRGVNFKWDNSVDQEFIISQEENNKNQIGLIAQEVEQVYPELVYLNGIKNYKSVRYAEIVSVLIEAVKELKQENENLKTRITVLENK